MALASYASWLMAVTGDRLLWCCHCILCPPFVAICLNARRYLLSAFFCGIVRGKVVGIVFSTVYRVAEQSVFKERFAA